MLVFQGRCGIVWGARVTQLEEAMLDGQGLPVNLYLPGFISCLLLLKLLLSSSSQGASVLCGALNIVASSNLADTRKFFAVILGGFHVLQQQ